MIPTGCKLNIWRNIREWDWNIFLTLFIHQESMIALGVRQTSPDPLTMTKQIDPHESMVAKMLVTDITMINDYDNVDDTWCLWREYSVCCIDTLPYWALFFLLVIRCQIMSTFDIKGRHSWSQWTMTIHTTQCVTEKVHVALDLATWLRSRAIK